MFFVGEIKLCRMDPSKGERETSPNVTTMIRSLPSCYGNLAPDSEINNISLVGMNLIESG